MLTADLPLFQRWPKLQAVLPHQSLADLPTPVKPLLQIHKDNAWVKCDDLSHREYGGNKIRKLEFVLPELQQRNINHLITLGGVGSNSGVAVAMMCQHYNIKCTIFVFDQAPSATVTKNYQLMSSYGAHLVHTQTAVQAGLRYYLNIRRFDRRAYFLWAGCSTTATVFAYINAMLELKQQMDAGLCPMFDSVFVPAGSCSTVAGLTLGAALLDLPIVIKGVRVAQSYAGPVPACTPGIVTQQMHAAIKQLSRVYPEYKNFTLPIPTMLENYYGDHYGVSTPLADKAIATGLTQENLKLEQTYTGKTFAAFLDEVNQGNGRHLFWNTHYSG